MDATRNDAFFLDFDGTLIDTAPTPDGARAGSRVRDVLRRLMAATRGATMIVTGRPIAVLDAMLHIRLPAAGQHGAEIRFFNPALESVHIGVERYDELLDRCGTIRDRHPGSLLEDKNPTVALHLEAGTPAFLSMLSDMRALAAEWDGRLACIIAHNVVELRPAHINKGRVLDCAALFRPFAGRRPIFIGNDIPDIDGFHAATAGGGYGVSVGTTLEGARYQIDSPDRVLDTLERIAAAA
ncbi:MAG: trehalose-phosphatase [Alphaproteobacteria bacterium]|nr:trehalose-phosphatase [Alphaproteobacteria bacterium]